MVLFPASNFKFYSPNDCKSLPNLHDQKNFFHKGDHFLWDFILSFNYPPVVLKVVIIQLTFSLNVKSLSR